MIKKIKNKIKSVLKYVPFIPKSENVLKKISISKSFNKIRNIIKPQRTIPAPDYLIDDPWFGKPILSQRALDTKTQDAYNKKVEAETNPSKESPNIHQEMYEMATKNWTTVKETQGGSENFHEGPNGWNSGTGINQFR